MRARRFDRGGGGVHMHALDRACAPGGALHADYIIAAAACMMIDSRLHSRYARVRTRAKLRSASRSATTCTNASITSYNFAACCLLLQSSRLRTADFLPLRSCCQSASDWCMSDEPQQAQQEPSVLEHLATAAKEDAKELCKRVLRQPRLSCSCSAHRGKHAQTTAREPVT